MSTLRKPGRVTVAEFQLWHTESDGERWHLIDGEPVLMAPASEDHGRIQAEAAFLIGAHLRERRPGCDVIIAPGVVPHVRSAMNERIADIAVSCTPSSGGRTITAPVLLVEILSPSNEAITRANVWAYTTIPSVQEVLLLASVEIGAELLRRGADERWPADPVMIRDGDDIEFSSIGFRAPLRAFYRTTSLLRR